MRKHKALVITLIVLNLFLWPVVIITYLNYNEPSIDPSDDRSLTQKPLQENTSQLSPQQDTSAENENTVQIPNTIEGRKNWLRKVLGEEFQFSPGKTYDTKGWSGEKILALRIAEDIWHFENGLGHNQ